MGTAFKHEVYDFRRAWRVVTTWLVAVREILSGLCEEQGVGPGFVRPGGQRVQRRRVGRDLAEQQCVACPLKHACVCSVPWKLQSGRCRLLA